MLGLDMDAGGGSGFDLRMEDESLPPAKVTIIEMGESDFGSERDLDIEGEEWLTLQCPECGNTFKVSSHDRSAKCDRCGLESEIG
jgi:ribosomal protein S27AE